MEEYSWEERLKFHTCWFMVWLNFYLRCFPPPLVMMYFMQFAKVSTWKLSKFNLVSLAFGRWNILLVIPFWLSFLLQYFDLMALEGSMGPLLGLIFFWIFNLKLVMNWKWRIHDFHIANSGKPWLLRNISFSELANTSISISAQQIQNSKNS